MATLPQGLTLEEFLALPEEKPALEFLDGMVSRKGEPTGRHSMLQGMLTAYLNHYAEPTKRAMALLQLRTTFNESSLVVDVAVYRWERIPQNDRGEIADDFLEAPDIAIEIASPEESRPALVRKCAWYVQHGVSLALLVDPDDGSVLVFRSDGRSGPLRGADMIHFDPVLPGLRLAVQKLFGWLRNPAL